MTLLSAVALAYPALSASPPVNPVAYRPLMRLTTAFVVTSQLGFTPKDDRFAVLAEAPGAVVDQFFRVVDAYSGKTVYESQSGDMRYFGESWKGSDDTGDTYTMDLNRWQAKPGTYRIESNGLSSYPFRIADNIYDVRKMDPLYFFRVQESGVSIKWEALDGVKGSHGPDYKDDRPGETGDGGGADPLLLEQPPVLPPSERIDVSGGWFDAGDYNKYMGNTPWAVYNLLLAYEDSPDYWNKLDQDRNGRSDILDVAKPALDWMLKMMYKDGSVFERIYENRTFSFDGRPDLETDNIPNTLDDRPVDTDRWADITAKSSYAMGLAYRLYKDSDPAAADKYLDMATRTWAWALKNQNIVKAKKYGAGLYFGSIEDGLTLGAVELFKATGERRYLDYAGPIVAAHLKAGDWAEPSGWDYHRSYALERFYPHATPDQQARILQQIGDRVQRGLSNQSLNPYRANGEFLNYGHGMNDVATSHAMDALWMHKQTGDKDYYTYALNQFQWIWGRNAFNKSWLASTLVADGPPVVHSRVTNSHPLNGVVVPGTTDFDNDGLPDYSDSDFWPYSEATINQQAIYTRAAAALYLASGGGA